MTDRRRHLRAGVVVLYLAMLILSYAVGQGVYWTLAPYEVLSAFDTGPRQVMQEKVAQGGFVTVHSAACKATDAPGIITRAFVDGAVFLTPPVASTLSGCRNGVEALIPIPVPHTLPPGRYHLEVSIMYQVNPLRSKVYRYTTTEFDVEAAKPR